MDQGIVDIGSLSLGGTDKHCFSLVMYGFCSGNDL